MSEVRKNLNITFDYEDSSSVRVNRYNPTKTAYMTMNDILMQKSDPNYLGLFFVPGTNHSTEPTQDQLLNFNSDFTVELTFPSGIPYRSSYDITALSVWERDDKSTWESYFDQTSDPAKDNDYKIWTNEVNKDAENSDYAFFINIYGITLSNTTSKSVFEIGIIIPTDSLRDSYGKQPVSRKPSDFLSAFQSKFLLDVSLSEDFLTMFEATIQDDSEITLFFDRLHQQKSIAKINPEDVLKLNYNEIFDKKDFSFFMGDGAELNGSELILDKDKLTAISASSSPNKFTINLLGQLNDEQPSFLGTDIDNLILKPDWYLLKKHEGTVNYLGQDVYVNGQGQKKKITKIESDKYHFQDGTEEEIASKAFIEESAIIITVDPSKSKQYADSMFGPNHSIPYSYGAVRLNSLNNGQIIKIDWGDGQAQTYTHESVEKNEPLLYVGGTNFDSVHILHEYSDDSIKNIMISGDIKGFGSLVFRALLNSNLQANWPGLFSLINFTRLKSFGGAQLENLDFAFDACPFLVEVPNVLPDTVTSMKYAFRQQHGYVPVANWTHVVRQAANVIENKLDSASPYWVSNSYTDEGYNYIDNLDEWDIKNVKDIQGIFMFNKSFLQSLESWSFKGIENADQAFYGATSYNAPIGPSSGFSTFSNLQTANSMFEGAETFNQPINYWSIPKLVSANYMFKGAEAFNQPLDYNFDIFRLKNAQGMFMNAISFNQPLSFWRTEMLENVSEMFKGAASFSQDLSAWCTSSITDNDSFADGSAMQAIDLPDFTGYCGTPIITINDLSVVISNFAPGNNTAELTINHPHIPHTIYAWSYNITDSNNNVMSQGSKTLVDLSPGVGVMKFSAGWAVQGRTYTLRLISPQEERSAHPSIDIPLVW